MGIFYAWVYDISFLFSPNLSWRDVQYLFAYTSKLPSDAEYCEPKTNGAGLNYSSYCGFGVIDAEAFVSRAHYWTPVGKAVNQTWTVIDS